MSQGTNTYKMFNRPSCKNVASLNLQQFISSRGLVAYLIADKGSAGILFKKKISTSPIIYHVQCYLT